MCSRDWYGHERRNGNLVNGQSGCIDSEMHDYLVKHGFNQWICHCMWSCVTIVHTIEGLTSLFIGIDMHPSSATILGRPNTMVTT